MVTSVTMRESCWLDGTTAAAQDLRLDTVSALSSGLGSSSASNIGVGSGVRQGNNGPLRVAVSSGLSVTVNPGMSVIQGTAAANSGAYSNTLDSVATLTCATADPVNPRLDTVCVTVTDVGTSSSATVVQIVTGTPASSPVAPTLPANSLALCNIAVAANATTLVSGNLSDQRVYYAAAGGIKPVSGLAFYPTSGSISDYLHNTNSGRLLWFNGTSVQAPKTALFAPVTDGPHTGTATGTPVTVASQTATPDGSTTVEITFTYNFISNAGTSAGNACTLTFLRGATNLRSVTKTCWGADSNIDGGSITIWDTNPAAGTYTYSVTVVNQGAGTFAVQGGSIMVKAISS